MRFTGERLLTDVKGRLAIEHLHRYAITLDWIHGKRVLDIASGEGYGSNLMASKADHVTGVDVDAEAISHAQTKYKRDNLMFVQGSATQIPLPDQSIDIVVSFETIEHLTDHDQMMREVKRVLRNDGTLIISSPDKRSYSDARSHQNDFHLRELYQEEFEKLIRDNFRYADFYLQGFAIGSLIQGGKPAFVVRQYSGQFDKIDDSVQANHTYNLAVCSDAPLVIKCSNSIFNDEKMFYAIDEFYEKKIKSVYESASYRLGNFFVELYRKVVGRKS